VASDVVPTLVRGDKFPQNMIFFGTDKTIPLSNSDAKGKPLKIKLTFFMF